MGWETQNCSKGTVGGGRNKEQKTKGWWCEKAARERKNKGSKKDRESDYTPHQLVQVRKTQTGNRDARREGHTKNLFGVERWKKSAGEAFATNLTEKPVQDGKDLCEAREALRNQRSKTGGP